MGAENRRLSFEDIALGVPLLSLDKLKKFGTEIMQTRKISMEDAKIPVLQVSISAYK